MEIDKLPVYARGWIRLDEREILDALESWEKSSLPLWEDRLLFYCYSCGFPKYASMERLRHGHWPKCPYCKRRMAIYDDDELRRWRKKRADVIRAAISHGLLRIFSETAEKCGGVKKWALLTNGILLVDSRCARFWYDPTRQSVEGIFYKDAYEAEKTLERVVKLNATLFYTVKK
jgi:hypothetical protein